MTPNTATSSTVGVRPSRSTMRAYSSSVRPWSTASSAVTGRLAGRPAWCLTGDPSGAGHHRRLATARWLPLAEPGLDGSEELQAVLASREAIGGVLGMRHEAEDVARRVAHPGDVRERAVRVRLRHRTPGPIGVPEHDLLVRLERRDRRLVRHVASLAVLDGKLEQFAPAAAVGERGIGGLDTGRDHVAHEAPAPVPH